MSVPLAIAYNPRPHSIWSPDSQSYHMGPIPPPATTRRCSHILPCVLGLQGTTVSFSCSGIYSRPHSLLDAGLSTLLALSSHQAEQATSLHAPQEAWDFAPHNPVSGWNLLWLSLWDLSVLWPPWHLSHFGVPGGLNTTEDAQAEVPTFPGAKNAVVLGVFSNLWLTVGQAIQRAIFTPSVLRLISFLCKLVIKLGRGLTLSVFCVYGCFSWMYMFQYLWFLEQHLITLQYWKMLTTDKQRK